MIPERVPICQTLCKIADLIPDAAADVDMALRQQHSPHLKSKLHELMASLYRVRVLVNEICDSAAA